MESPRGTTFWSERCCIRANKRFQRALPSFLIGGEHRGNCQISGYRR
jgi:hypothetical protein